MNRYVLFFVFINLHALSNSMSENTQYENSSTVDKNKIRCALIELLRITPLNPTFTKAQVNSALEYQSKKYVIHTLIQALKMSPLSESVQSEDDGTATILDFCDRDTVILAVEKEFDVLVLPESLPVDEYGYRVAHVFKNICLKNMNDHLKKVRYVNVQAAKDDMLEQLAVCMGQIAQAKMTNVLGPIPKYMQEELQEQEKATYKEAYDKVKQQSLPGDLRYLFDGTFERDFYAKVRNIRHWENRTFDVDGNKGK